jgi:ABC-type glycerol-3-phosphate transport system permease component
MSTKLSTKPISNPGVTTPLQTAQPQRRFFSRYRLQAFITRLLGYLILLTLTMLSAFPLLWMALTSLRARSEVFSGNLLPRQVTLAAYQFIWSELHIMTFFGNSVWVTFWTVTVVVALATLAGYAFAHIDFWGKQVIFLTLLSTLMVPGAVLIIPLFLQLRLLNLIDTQLGLILAYIGGGLAFAVFLMRSFFETLPSELVDAGHIDGASEFAIFWRIMLPLAKPGIATITIFQFMGTWNEFIFAATFVHTPELRTLQPTIFAMVGRYSTNWPALAAGLTISVLPIIIVYVFMQRHFVAGLTSGAVKG